MEGYTAKSKSKNKWLLRLNHWERTRKVRRWFTVLWNLLLGFEVWIALHTILKFGDGTNAFIVLFGSTFMAAVCLYSSWVAMDQPSLEERALVECEVPFEGLTEEQRKEVILGDRREKNPWRFRSIGRRPDEREMTMRRKAEAAAYRILRPALVVFLLGYWLVCLAGPFGVAAREALAVSAVAISWLVMMILGLPLFVRMWTEPDEEKGAGIRIAEEEGGLSHVEP